LPTLVTTYFYSICLYIIRNHNIRWLLKTALIMLWSNKSYSDIFLSHYLCEHLIFKTYPGTMFIKIIQPRIIIYYIAQKLIVQFYECIFPRFEYLLLTMHYFYVLFDNNISFYKHHTDIIRICHRRQTGPRQGSSSVIPNFCFPPLVHHLLLSSPDKL